MSGVANFIKQWGLLKSQLLRPSDILAAQNGLNGIFPNGSCQDAANTGWTEAQFRADERPPGSSGCFTWVSTGSSITSISDDFLQADVNSLYELSADFKQIIKTSGSGVIAYFGVMMYDADKLDIYSQFVLRRGDTTLASDLSPGDTQIHLVNAAGWDVTGTNSGISFYTYRNSEGRLYDRAIEPYTRYFWWKYPSKLFDSASGNDINLTAPWDYPNPAAGSGGVWPAGTPVSNGFSGGTYNYRLAAGYTPPTDRWERRQAFIGGGIDLSGNDNQTLFRPGTHYVKLLCLPNYQGQTGDTLGVGNISVYRAPITRAIAGL